jgi:hypothetical protein
LHVIPTLPGAAHTPGAIAKAATPANTAKRISHLVQICQTDSQVILHLSRENWLPQK